MKAAFLVKKGSGAEAFELREVNKPEPLKDEVLIKVNCFGLNYADVMARRGLYREAPPMPCIIGYEVVGIIEAVGDDSNKDWIGKKVVGFTRFGGYAEYATTSVKAIAEIGDMDEGEAAAIAVQYATAYYMSWDTINLYQGDKVMIHAGAGGVGTALIQLCKLKGCEVFSNAGSDEKLEFMKAQGADHVMNYRNEDYLEKIKKLLNKEKITVAFNPIAGSTFKKDLELIGSGGKVILFGGSELSGSKWGFFSSLNFMRKMGLLLPIVLMMKSKSVLGVNMLKIGDNEPAVLERCLKNVVDLVNQGKLKPHVGGRFNISDLGKAHDFLESRKSVGKVVVYWNENQ